MRGHSESPIFRALRWTAAIALPAGVAGCGGGDPKPRVADDACGAQVRDFKGPTTRLTYRSTDDVVADIPVLCKRLRALNVTTRVEGEGRDKLVIEVASKDAVGAKSATRTGQLGFYDWEINVIGPAGEPAPDDVEVTGGVNAGRSGALEHYDAVLRASKRAADVEADNGRKGSRFYAVDPRKRAVFGAGAPTRSAALAAVAPAEREQAEVREVKPGTVVLRGELDPGATTAGRYFVLRDDVALRAADVRDPKQGFEEGPSGGGAPVVTFGFTDAGAKAFAKVTRAIARRGSRRAAALSGQASAEANQHFAIVLDDQIVAIPYIDFRANPQGIDGSVGSLIQGGFTIASARVLASILRTGPLELPLELVGTKTG